MCAAVSPHSSKQLVLCGASLRAARARRDLERHRQPARPVRALLSYTAYSLLYARRRRRRGRRAHARFHRHPSDLQISVKRCTWPSAPAEKIHGCVGWKQTAMVPRWDVTSWALIILTGTISGLVSRSAYTRPW